MIKAFIVLYLIFNLINMKKTLFLLLFPILFLAQKAHLKKEISEITEDKNATVAVSVLGIDFHFEYNNENAEKHLPMLSVFKFHIALAALDLVNQGKLDLDQKIKIEKADLHENTWSPLREKFPNGTELTLAELIDYSVAWSDNNTTDILLNVIGGTKTVQDFMDAKGVKNFQIKYNEQQMHQGAEFLYENYTSTASLTHLLKDFYLGKIISKSSTEFLYKILLGTTTGTTKLVEQLPQGVVAHKTGSSGQMEDGLTIAENDAGIVTLPNGKHYAITVFVIDSMENPEVNQKIVSDISKVVWDYFVNSK